VGYQAARTDADDQALSSDDARAHAANRPFGPGGIDTFDSLFVRWRIREGATEDLLDRLADWASAQADTPSGERPDSRTLLPVAGVGLVTLFLDRSEDSTETGNGEIDDLLWYLEVADDNAEEWDDPVE
jgi:hypothetical protein